MSHGSHGSSGSHGSHSSHGCSDCCNCVKEMAEKLEKFVGQRVLVFEEHAFIFGTIRKVKDDSVLVLEDFAKTASFGNVTIALSRVDVPLFVSICKITEFIPLPSGLASTVLENLQKINATKLL